MYSTNHVKEKILMAFLYDTQQIKNSIKVLKEHAPQNVECLMNALR